MRWKFVLALGMVGCGSGPDAPVTAPVPVPVAAVVSVVLTPASLPALLVGTATRLSAVAQDAQGNPIPARTITWSSSVEAIATVAIDGVVTGVAAGIARIRATSDGKFAELDVTIRPQPWTLTGSLAGGRTLLSLTLLANGNALAVGGQALGAPFQTLRTCELYDAATGSWRTAGGLTTARANHVAIRLANGMVLVAGGYSIELSTRLASAELYDPASDSWRATASMSEARTLAAAALLPDGRVLVVGGSGSGTDLNALASAEIYDPVTERWSAAQGMAVARSGHTATTLTDGRVVVAGGATGTYAVPTLHSAAEVFTAATGAWSSAGIVGTSRGFHRAVALPNGRLLMTGGSDFVAAVVAASEVFDATTGAWTAVAPLAAGRLSHSATLLGDNRVLVAGGGASAPLGSTELFDAATGQWVSAGTMRVPRSNHAAVLLLSGKVLVAGGQGVGASTSAEIYDPG